MSVWILLSLFFLGSSPSVGPRSIVHMQVPTYPVVARTAQIEGEVKITVQISPDGRVKNVIVNGGPLMLREEADINARTWVFAKSDSETTQDIVYDFLLVPHRSDNICSYVTLESPERINIFADRPQPES